MKTLSQILTDINAVIDLEASLPTGDELTARINYVNQALFDASALGQLSEFKREYIVSATGATVSLPDNFREAQENPRFLDSSGTWQEYELIEAEQKYQRNSTERYCYIMGDPSEGYNLIVNSLMTGATLSLVYQRYPSGMATYSHVCELTDPQYIVRKVESYVLYSRSDDRFVIAEQRAEKSLANMMGREAKGTTGSKDTKMKFKHPLQNLV